MVAAVWGLLAGSPMNLALWVGNRLATWTGLFFVWKKLHGQPHRVHWFLLWGALVNAVSLAGLLVVLHALK